MQGMPGAIRCVGFMGNDVFKEGPIGKPSALLVLEARPSTDEDPRSQLGRRRTPVRMSGSNRIREVEEDH